MKTTLARISQSMMVLFAALPALHTANLQAAITESNLNKTFSVKPGGQLMMDVDRGAILLKTTDASDVIVEVKRKMKGADSAKAQEIFTAHEVTFDQDGDQVAIRAKFKNDPSRWFNRGRMNLEVEYTVALPKQFNLDLRTGSGSIASSDIEGTVKVHSAGGDLKFATIVGPFDGSTGAGSIALEHATGVATVKSSGGDIRLGQMDDVTTASTGAGSVAVKTAKARLSVHSSGGDLRLGLLEGPTIADTGAGSISVDTAKATLKVGSSGGDLRLGELNDETVAETGAGSITITSGKATVLAKSAGGDIRLGKMDGETSAQTGSGSVSVKSSRAKLTVKSSGGDLRIEDAGSSVQAHTGSGSVCASFSAQPKGDCSLTSAGGDIRVKIREQLSFDIEAKTAGGDVMTELPITATVVGKPRSGELKGTLNDGGTTLLIKTGSGSIAIRKL